MLDQYFTLNKYVSITKISNQILTAYLVTLEYIN